MNWKELEKSVPCPNIQLFGHCDICNAFEDEEENA